MNLHLEHANITVQSIDETLRFLGTAFPEAKIRGSGFIHNDAELGDWVHFGAEDSYIAIQQNRSHQTTEQKNYQHDGINHLGFLTEDIDSLISRLSKSGYDFTNNQIFDECEFRRRVYFFDKNHFEWEFIEYKSDTAQERNQY